MKAVTWKDFGAQPELRDDAPEPAPGPGEVLVRVHASSVNPIDNAIAAGMLKEMLSHEFPVTLGRDFAGVVEQVGEGVSSVAPGDEVFGTIPPMAPPVHNGAWAERIVSSEQTLARRPEDVEAATAGAAGLAAVTAVNSVDALELSPGDTVLVVGATGGVGGAAAQLAVAAGATVIAPGLPEDEEFLRGLGVSEVVPREGDVAAAVRERHPDGVDAILDAASFTPGGYDGALKAGGRVSSPTNAAGQGPGRTNVMNAPSPEVLGRIARHLADGTLRVPIQRSYDLDEAPEALQELARGHTQGKTVLRVG
jgi:NADPH:quinone reductase-like Zn-dependent oxidoreductase